ncbi:MAG: OmpH family outer membrane protein [Bacteroidales bacterium]|jgi:outer membrane protein|nr:OmpH family outer membrane protein [Bacteroidales bacterium]MBO7256448.1 OmpH family outer membrane protein [Bacteroidales bacterium]MBO7284595.1 OmpH family outer membrane protein [Bacteroidales bacterium]MBO7322379.1 OmpH family outer membrane protein [Bacteroidales bacterium]MBQ5747872.1 OmpH family outer membrane protein [Bacteroidales bacterium]
MKKANIILHIISLVAIVVLFVMFLGQKNCNTANIETTSAEQTVAANNSIVYIQLDTLINQYDMYNDLKTEFEGKLASVENELTKKGRALENDYQSFNEKMSKGLLTRSQAEAQGNELQARQQELALLSQEKQMQLAEEESVMINQVMNAIQSYIKEYNKIHNHSLILTTTVATNNVIDGESSLNITNDIIKGLNQEYVKNRNRK